MPNTHSIPDFGTLKWVAKLDSFDESEIVKIFESVIAVNGWAKNDEVCAYPDSPGYARITYQNGGVSFQEMEDEDIDIDYEDDFDP